MQTPTVVSVTPGSPADRVGVLAGDELLSVSGETIRDVIHYRMLVDADEVSLGLRRGSLEWDLDIDKGPGEPLGLEISAAVFDQVRTCDNHCEFCFIYQLPPGLRSSLYTKDDDYRLSFLYGNFTTLTRFTEADLERVITEGLSPLFVSIHATDPAVRNEMLRSRRGGPSLRWLRALLDHGVEVHGQIVLCPGLNDGEVLDDTLAGIADEYPELADVAVVPLGLSKYNTEPRMRVHTAAEAKRVTEQVAEWQVRFQQILGRPMVHAADELYLVGGAPFPPAETYGTFDMYEDGIGMVRQFEAEFTAADQSTANGAGAAQRASAGFFHWVDGAPGEGYRAPRWTPITEDGLPAAGPTPTPTPVRIGARTSAPVAILTGSYGARSLGPVIDAAYPKAVSGGRLRIVEVENRFFGGNVGVAGLLVGEDLARVLAEEPEDHRYLLPDVCLSGDRFLDGTAVSDLPRTVEVVATSGAALRRALGALHVEQDEHDGSL